MTKTTIYLARIIKLNDYAADTTIELEAFDTLEKAKSFMESVGMIELRYTWVHNEHGSWEGSIETLKVK